MNTSEALNVPDKSDKTADFDRPLGIIAESPAVVGDKKSENVRQKPTPRYQVTRRIFSKQPQFSLPPAEVIREKRILSNNQKKDASSSKGCS
ncbi:hypothetical protein [Pseudomonas fluorescens]|uniref:hypothetical protein n=1 Tax=Pseudomonas fluorescens TaxID=294 RepID=UPI00123FE354|nr:hypothetical protein [Pseudomonas fluorescens]